MKKLPVMAFLVILVLAACAAPTPAPTPSPSPTPRPTPTPTPNPAEMLSKSGDAVLAMTSAKFKLTREGAPAALDAQSNMTFSEVTGEYQAPDRVSAQVKVTVFGSVLEIQLLWLPEGDYMSNPLTGQMGPLPANTAFNGAALFQAGGIPAVLKGGIQNPTLVGTETVEDAVAYHFSGTADGAVLSPLTAGALTAGTLYPVDIWVEKDTFNLVRFHIAEPDGNGWLIEVYDINVAVDIQAP